MDDFLTQFNETLNRMETDEQFAHDVLVGKQGNPITLGPRVKSASNWVDDMVTGAKARSKRWLENSKHPKKDPKEAALAASGKYESRMREALDDKRWNDGVKNYDESAREKVIDAVGTSGFERGVETHKAKAESKINKLQPMVAALAATIDKMPQDTDSQRKERLLAAREGMLAIGKKMKTAS